MPRSRRNNHRRSITSVRSTPHPQPHRPTLNEHAPVLPEQPLPNVQAHQQQPPPTAQQGFDALEPHPVSVRGGFGGRGREGGGGNGWGDGGGYQDTTANTGSFGWTTGEARSRNGGGQNNNTGSSGWTATHTGGGGFAGAQGPGGASAEGGDVRMGSATADGSGIGPRWGSDAPGNGSSNDNEGSYNNGSNYNHGHNSDHHGPGGQRGGRGEWRGDRGIRGGRGGRGGRGDWGVRGRGDWGGRGGRGDWSRRGRGGRGGRGAWGGQGDAHDASNTHSSSGWGEAANNSINQAGQGQGAETHTTPHADASSVWGGTGTNTVGINNTTENRGNDWDANSGWGTTNVPPQTAWTSTKIERTKRPTDQISGNAVKKLKCYVLQELEQVRRRVEEWEAGWDEEREGEGIVERAIEGGGLVEKMVWQSEATFLVVWPPWMWGASRIDGRRFSWAKSVPWQRMPKSEDVVEPE